MNPCVIRVDGLYEATEHSLLGSASTILTSNPQIGSCPNGETDNMTEADLTKMPISLVRVNPTAATVPSYTTLLLNANGVSSDPTSIIASIDDLIPGEYSYTYKVGFATEPDTS